MLYVILHVLFFVRVKQESRATSRILRRGQNYFPLFEFFLIFSFPFLSLLLPLNFFLLSFFFFSFSFIILFFFVPFYSEIKISGTMRFAYVRFLFLISGCTGVSRSETREYERTRSFLREKRYLLFPDPKDSETKVQVRFLFDYFFFFLLLLPLTCLFLRFFTLFDYKRRVYDTIYKSRDSQRVNFITIHPS